jgi:hypothetical protein
MAIGFIVVLGGVLGTVWVVSRPQPVDAVPAAVVSAAPAQTTVRPAETPAAAPSALSPGDALLAEVMKIEPADRQLLSDAAGSLYGATDAFDADAQPAQTAPAPSASPAPATMPSSSTSTASASSGSGGSDASGTVSGSTLSGASGGSAGGSADGASGDSATETAPTAPSSTGGGVGGGAIKGPTKHMLHFGGQRNQSSFNMLNDPVLKMYFAPDFVWHITTFKKNAEFDRMIFLLRQLNPQTIIGYYHSACTTEPSRQDFNPPTKIPLEEVKSDWFLTDNNGKRVTWPGTTNRYYLDIRKQEVRQAIISLAIARTKYYRLDSVNYDNCYWGYGIADISKEDWTAGFMEFYKEAGEAAHENDLLCIINVATRADLIDDAFNAMAPYVDGMMTETAFHPNIRTSPHALRAELQGYEDMVKQGKKVFLFPRYEEDLEFTLKSIRPIAEQYGNIYVCNKGTFIPNTLYEMVK